MPNAERRRCPRFSFEASAVAMVLAVYRDVRVIDISMHGALLQARKLAAFLAGPNCTLRIRIPGGGAHDLAATVVYRRGEDLAGLRVINPGAATQKLLRCLIWNTFSKRDASVVNPVQKICSEIAGTPSRNSPSTARSRFSGALVVWEETVIVQLPADRPCT